MTFLHGLLFIVAPAIQPTSQPVNHQNNRTDIPAFKYTIYILMALQKRIKTILITKSVMKKNNADDDDIRFPFRQIPYGISMYVSAQSISMTLG